MKIKFFAGKWDSWGLEVSYCHYYKGLTIALLHWYVGFEIWTKKEIADMEKNRKQLADLIASWREEEEPKVKAKPAKVKAKKAPAKKKAVKKG